MRYENDDVGLSFDLPVGWRRDEHNLTITFYGPNGGLGAQSEVIQLMIGGIAPSYAEPAAREKYLSELGAKVFRTQIGGEQNAVVLEKATNSEISVVRDGVHYSFSHANDAASRTAIECIRDSARFPPHDHAAHAIRKASDPKTQAVTKALRADFPEAARRALSEAGAPGVRIEGGTFHDLADIRRQK
jgi:hypothetical protein